MCHLVPSGKIRLTNVTYFYLAGSAIILGTWVIVVAMATYLKRKFSGFTGDKFVLIVVR